MADLEYESKQLPPHQRWSHNAVVTADDLNDVIQMLIEQGNNMDHALDQLINHSGGETS